VLEVWNGSAWKEAAPNNINASTITSGILPTARLGTSLDPGDYLAVDSSYNIVGTPAPQIFTSFYNNPTVGTTFTAASASVVLTGSTQYQIVFTSHVIDTDSSSCQLTVKLTVGSTSYTYTGTIAATFQGQVTATRFLTTASATSTTVKVDLKVSAGSRSIDTFINAIGMN
jgi:hypothetical protein